MNDNRFRVGDRVVIDPQIARPAQRGVVYRVIRILKVNVTVLPVVGGRPVRINPGYLLPEADAPAPSTTSAVDVPYVPPLEQGTVVTVAGSGWKQPPDQLYLVLRDNGDGNASIVKLGGDAGRYWRGVRRTLITIVDPTRITLAPAATTLPG